jgi:hypothetical protein
MTICYRCRKLLPGRFDATELVLCKDCEKWLNPDHLKIKVPKLDEETIKKLSPKVEKKKVLPDERI